MSELNKKILRKHLLEIRSSLPEEYVIENSRKIIESLKHTTEYINSRVIFSYISYSNEVNTIEFIKEGINTKKICVPKIINEKIMVPYYINSLDNLVNNKFNILEPNPKNSDIADTKDIDVIVTPGVGFDMELNRLGHGRGYYDRFFKNIKDTAIKIGLCFEYQIMESIPNDNFDVKVDMIITEKRIIGGKNE